MFCNQNFNNLIKKELLNSTFLMGGALHLCGFLRF